ncbi:MAG TPA: ABC transporter ATP-binding protein [Candidatus Saccharimonadales bacterium]|nr:ABC transporter ATP-binding protein [Candidatus Saccharimonadales bacterium]
MENIIVVNNLVKKFGSFAALNKLNLTVKKGEVHGFLGPNGAGKSTTIRVLLGILRKTSGHVEVLGGDPWADATKLHRSLAYVPGDVNLWPNLSGGEAIDLFGSLRGGLDRRRRKELLDRFELDATKKCRTYSKGNRQKVALVAALASDVDLYIMDEPTSGLDPIMEAVFQDYVRQLKDQGKTVLLSSHILAEAEALCDRLTIIREGQAVESGTLGDLRHLTRTSVSVETMRPIKDLQKIPGLFNLTVHGPRAKFEVETDKIDDALKHILQFDIKELVSSPPSLEELFLRHYDKTPSEQTTTQAEEK